ncbi:MAG: dephospho-CoA kinase [Candidatus Omnitrophica bacterium]|nr:dephospho-CoA kinase [Candidatus Omnitrophota bacterium]MBD3269226.1 dephospho-CoA kinase [Candidatus Omnitrophota bacterium]
MPVFGLTGNLACGKSTLLKRLKKKGAEIFDTDKRIHDYYRNPNSRIFKNIRKFFPGVVTGKKICRRKLGKIVFADKNKLRILEGIVHPVVIEDLLSWIKKAKRKGTKIYVAEVPLLFEKKLEDRFDYTILVKTRRDILISRLKEKYGFSEAEAGRRLSLYLPLKYKIRRSDFVINNNCDLEEFKKEVDLLWKRMKQN